MKRWIVFGALVLSATTAFGQQPDVADLERRLAEQEQRLRDMSREVEALRSKTDGATPPTGEAAPEEALP